MENTGEDGEMKGKRERETERVFTVCAWERQREERKTEYREKEKRDGEKTKRERREREPCGHAWKLSLSTSSAISPTARQAHRASTAQSPINSGIRFSRKHFPFNLQLLALPAATLSPYETSPSIPDSAHAAPMHVSSTAKYTNTVFHSPARYCRSLTM